ncbi:MAG: hypothetical protein HXY20_03625 [Acidobacteria bacterium]|nr:hypothetical protein [Acidobacteriota bacterium]
MRFIIRSVSSLLCGLWLAAVGPAQTADEVIEKHISALGGRKALSRLSSRVMTGTVTVTGPSGDVTGSIEIYSKAPNKTRTLMKLDLKDFGIGEMVFDQRFDGTSGYIIDSINGNREITGNQLDHMRNAAFPSTLLRYREMAISVELAGHEKVGDRDAYILILRPKTGSESKHYLDATTCMVLKMAFKIDVPQMGEVEQVSEFSDYRTVDGVKVPYAMKMVNPAQTLTVRFTRVEHNKTLDDATFARK